MAHYTASQKIAIIKEIADDSRDLCLMIRDNASLYCPHDIKSLFIDILNRDAKSYNRFTYESSLYYINTALNEYECDLNSPDEMLNACARVTSKDKLSYFLFT